MVDLGYVFAGFFVGTIMGLTGVGGGSLMTPLLIFFFGVKPYMAVGTDLLFAAFSTLGGIISFARQRIVAADCLCRAPDLGGGFGPCVARLGGLAFAGQTAGGLAARYLAGLAPDAPHA